MISVYRADQLKRFAPFSYLNHSFILSLNVKICIRFTVFLQISHCFFTCQELRFMRDLCISFTSSCFLFPVGRGSKAFEDYGRLKNFRMGRVTNLGGLYLLGGSVPHFQLFLNDQYKIIAKVFSRIFVFETQVKVCC